MSNLGKTLEAMTNIDQQWWLSVRTQGMTFWSDDTSAALRVCIASLDPWIVRVWQDNELLDG